MRIDDPDKDKIEGFEWDKGNSEKNWVKHKVSAAECEQVFLNEPLIMPNLAHSQMEERFVARGHTDNDRLLFISFTLRGRFVRVVSARDMNRKERAWYYGQIKKDPPLQD